MFPIKATAADFNQSSVKRPISKPLRGGNEGTEGRVSARERPGRTAVPPRSPRPAGRGRAALPSLARGKAGWGRRLPSSGTEVKGRGLRPHGGEGGKWQEMDAGIYRGPRGVRRGMPPPRSPTWASPSRSPEGRTRCAGGSDGRARHVHDHPAKAQDGVLAADPTTPPVPTCPSHPRAPSAAAWTPARRASPPGPLWATTRPPTLLRLAACVPVCPAGGQVPGRARLPTSSTGPHAHGGSS